LASHAPERWLLMFQITHTLLAKRFAAVAQFVDMPRSVYKRWHF